jgi:GNAT superfamily N-acetyltransferase
LIAGVGVRTWCAAGQRGEERGRGVGTQLLDAVDAELARRGVHDLMIGVMEGNDDARRGLVPGWRQLYRLAAAER